MSAADSIQNSFICPFFISNTASFTQLRSVAAPGGRVRLALVVLVGLMMAFCTQRATVAQCYQFTSGNNASLSLNISNLPKPTITTGETTTYNYVLTNGVGNSAILTDLGSTYTSGTVLPYLAITTDSQSDANYSDLTIEVQLDRLNPADSATVYLQSSVGAYFPNGITATLPPLVDWNQAYQLNPTTASIGSTQYFLLTAISSCTPPSNAPNPTTLGFCQKCIGNGTHPGIVGVADPITVATGNLFEMATDYTTSGQNPLSFARYYNSMENVSYPKTLATTLGTNWRTNYDRYLQIISGSRIDAERPDGQVVSFTLNGQTWSPDSDMDIELKQSGSTWTLIDHEDTTEIYVVSGSKGVLQSIVARNGYAQNLNYSGGLLATVIDSYNRSLTFAYTAGLLQTVTTPDDTTLTYGFSDKTGGNALTSVTFSTTPSTSLNYIYGNSSFPFDLTGILDEDGNNFAAWTYDATGRAVSSQHGTGADLTTLVFNPDGTTTVSNAFGVSDSYTFTSLQGLPKVTQISRAATSSTAAATETFTYDGNGYVASRTDWNGDQTSYVNDAHGDPTAINEAVGSSIARTTNITYDQTWVHLPASITTSGLTTNYTYDGTGEILTKTLADTTTGTTPYSTGGQTRTWTNTWSNALLASSQTPDGFTTKFAYDTSGALTSITDPLGHVTNITSHTGGGYPQTIVDPNSVTTSLTYDPRMRLTSSTINGTGGTYKTSWTYDPAGNLITTTLPDNSYLTYGYDTAHRLNMVTDALGNYVSYSLDALGDRQKTTIYAKNGTPSFQRSGSFDALGRLLVDTEGAGQTVTRTFDANSNVLTVQDGLANTTTNTYDGLNRLSTSTDANGGVTTPTYDTHDRIVSVTDANGNTTAYTRDGFGDVIQQTSPDSGTTVYNYDADGNLTGKTDARGIVVNQTFDKLDRLLTTSYPADSSENVAYTYDQTGSVFAFGIGRLTSVTDAAGSLTRQYDERGNLANEARVNGKTTLSTGYTYDGANRVASLTYPDTTVVTYQRDAAGYISTVQAQLPGATAAMTIATMTHLPFGPMNGATYGNGVAESWIFDQAYRATNITDVLSRTNLQNLTYVYDSADNVKSISDGANATNSQSLGYDVLNRLTTAVSGSGGYGSFTWTYDKVGNRQTEVLGSTTTTYGYNPGTNQLATITIATTTSAANSARRIGRPDRSTTLALITPTSGTASRAVRSSLPSSTESPSIAPAVMLGWPVLLVGLVIVVRFRKRLLQSRWLALLPMALVLTGAGRLIGGCGRGNNGGGNIQEPIAATPAFSPGTGTYAAAQSVSLSDRTSGATIYYTTDGSTPTASSTKYGGPISVSATETIQAIATASGYSNSAVATAIYTINLPQAATPTFSPAGGTYSSAQSVTISDATSGAAIYYTTDGSTPSTSSAKYNGAIPVSSSTLIEAIATANGYANSNIATATYTLNLPAVLSVATNANGNITSLPLVAMGISSSSSESARRILAGVAASGNSGNATFTYNNANRLASVTGTAIAATFAYDWAGQRYSKTDGGSAPILYSYMQGGTLIAENDNGSVTDYVYADGRPIAALQPQAAMAANQVNYVHADRLGTPQTLTNSAGSVVWSTTYQPFGATGNINATVNQNLRLPGQNFDAETGFDYNLNRDYVPYLGRYLESDPIGLMGGMNTYQYAMENSSKYVDLLGLADNESYCPAVNDNSRPGVTETCTLASTQPLGGPLSGQTYCSYTCTDGRSRYYYAPAGQTCPQYLPAADSRLGNSVGSSGTPTPVIPNPRPNPAPAPSNDNFPQITPSPWWSVIPFLLPWPGNPFYLGA